ncbi:MAG: Molybdopterin synthase sulfur carrier subunit [Polaribacter sp. SA4-10]|nr:MAG: Molybdopterin synthase sulfur carrier subunit [Polaribacter sp. SA4-10]
MAFWIEFVQLIFIFELMKIKLLLFGITRDLLNANELSFEVLENINVGDLKKELHSKYPQVENISSYAIAVNESYANDDVKLREKDVVAIIPPVSGG